MKSVLILIVIAILIVPSLVAADVPKTLSYQGVLTDAGGAVVSDGTYSLTFRLYTASSGGTAVWEETQSVQVSKGIFNAILGDVNPLLLPFDTTYYLGISVEGGAELVPRVELAATAYSLNSDKVQGSNLLPATGYLGVGTTLPEDDIHIRRDVDGGIGITIDNRDTGPQSREGLVFRNENGELAAIYLYDDEHPAYPGAMRIFNNRPGGNIGFATGGFERMKISNSGNVGIGVSSPSQKLEVNGGVKLGNATSGTAGTIRWNGVDFEGYDGSSWKSLTSSGGTLPSGTAGQTLRNTGSGWTATSNLYNDGTRVGVGTTTPDATLDILGGNWDLDNTDGDLKIGDDTYKLKIGVATGGGGAGTAGIRMQGGLQRIVLGGGSKEVMQIDTTGTVTIGSASLDGSLIIDGSGFTSYAINGYTNTYGGNMTLFDESGISTISMQADVAGEGGWFKVSGGGSSYFLVDGNYANMGDPFVAINGTSYIGFNTSQTGDASVVLPNSSVSAAEMLNEPGVTRVRDYMFGSFALSGGAENIKSCSITAPSSGYVMVFTTCQLNIIHESGTTDYANFGVSDQSAAFPSYGAILVRIVSGAASGSYAQALTLHGLFPVDEGVNTFYFVGQLFGGSMNVQDLTMTCMFIPTAYGSVASPAPSSTDVEGGVVPKLTSSDIDRERDEAIRANMERIQRELDEMRRQLEAIKVDRNGNE